MHCSQQLGPGAGMDLPMTQAETTLVGHTSKQNKTTTRSHSVPERLLGLKAGKKLAKSYSTSVLDPCLHCLAANAGLSVTYSFSELCVLRYQPSKLSLYIGMVPCRTLAGASLRMPICEFQAGGHLGPLPGSGRTPFNDLA